MINNKNLKGLITDDQGNKCRVTIKNIKKPRITKWGKNGGVGNYSISRIPLESSSGEVTFIAKTQLEISREYQLTVDGETYELNLYKKQDKTTEGGTKYIIGDGFLSI